MLTSQIFAQRVTLLLQWFSTILYSWSICTYLHILYWLCCVDCICVHNCLAQSRPYAKDLHNLVIPHVGEKWYELGIQLLDANQESKLRSIRANYGQDVKKCCSETFEYWLETHPNCIWEQLVDALRTPAVELNNLAHIIEQRFSGMYFVCMWVSVWLLQCALYLAVQFKLLNQATVHS